MKITQLKSSVVAHLTKSTESNVKSYGILRKVVGCLGISLPWAVWVIAWYISGDKRQPSISAYYYTGARDVLVGTLCAIGIVLACHKGPQIMDWLVSVVAGLFCIGIALFPTTTKFATPIEEMIGKLHYTFAAIFFIAITVMVLFLFTKGDTSNPSKRRRNGVYWFCGLVMLICVVVMASQAILSADIKLAWKASGWTFVLETAAIEAFGVAWLTKGAAG